MKQKINILPEHLSIVQRILEHYLPMNTTVWVFGSRAKDNAKKFSDLDLAIDASDKLPSSIMSSIKFDLEESDLPFKVDVIDWNATSENFKNIISKDRVILWENKA